MKLSDFKGMFLQRTHVGYWQVLAAAAGLRDAVDVTLDALSLKELQRGPDGLALSPSVVVARVEAIAALDRELLLQRARDWPSVGEVSNDLGDTATDFIASAWRTAYRHIFDRVPVDGADTIRNYQIAQEAAACTGAVVKEVRSFSTLVALFDQGRVDYDGIRMLSRNRQFGPLTGEDVETLGRTVQSSHGPLQLLRVYRGSNDRPDLAATKILTELIANWHAMRTGEAGCFFEYLIQRQMLDPAHLRHEVLNALGSGTAPSALLPTYLLCLESGWAPP